MPCSPHSSHRNPHPTSRHIDLIPQNLLHIFSTPSGKTPMPVQPQFFLNVAAVCFDCRRFVTQDFCNDPACIAQSYQFHYPDLRIRKITTAGFLKRDYRVCLFVCLFVFLGDCMVSYLFMMVFGERFYMSALFASHTSFQQLQTYLRQ